MAGCADGMTAIQIKILITLACPNPRAATALNGDAHFFVRGELKIVFCAFNICKFHSFLQKPARE
jgi:hypothetical protein